MILPACHHPCRFHEEFLAPAKAPRWSWPAAFLCKWEHRCPPALWSRSPGGPTAAWNQPTSVSPTAPPSRLAKGLPDRLEYCCLSKGSVRDSAQQQGRVGTGGDIVQDLPSQHILLPRVCLGRECLIIPRKWPQTEPVAASQL